MPGMNDLGSGGDFDMSSALAEMSEGLGFESGGGDTLPGDDGLSTLLGDDTPPGEGNPLGADTLIGADTLTPAPAPELAPAPEAPKTWRKEALDHWAALPEPVRAEVLKREADMFKGLEGYKADAQVGKEFQAAIAPFAQALSQAGINPAAQVSGLMQAHFRLSSGTPQQKAAFLQQIAADYGVELAAADPDSQPFIDPAVQSLQTELEQVKSVLTENQKAQRAAKLNELTQQVQAFSADPKNAHFNDVATDVAELLRSGVSKTLEDAYEKAVWANPVTRAKEIARQTAERDSAARQAAAQRAEEARKASSAVVHTRPKRASDTTPLGSMDDTMKEVLANINGRAK